MIRDEGILHLCNCIVNIQLFINKQKDRTYVIFTWISIQALHPLLFLNSHYYIFFAEKLVKRVYVNVGLFLGCTDAQRGVQLVRKSVNFFVQAVP